MIVVVAAVVFEFSAKDEVNIVVVAAAIAIAVVVNVFHTL